MTCLTSESCEVNHDHSNFPSASCYAWTEQVLSEVKLYGLQVTYSSLPRAAGGPILRSSPGQLLFAQQQLRQTLTPPETLVNIVNFKSLGLFPGQAIQPATIQTLTGTTYKVQMHFMTQVVPTPSVSSPGSTTGQLCRSP